ncbi:ABC transporter substrate-binding protein [Moorena bouillonii PNG]|uniref:ABC transporter substrate-binding protein n=1 Tax=Moorena bouillonii PNG TaxID=568701 RepID=A0A1U7NBT8_9CYAN|nr:ABC transporter substrate-binding protein [Moorena bouillonii PNG]
MVYGAVGQPENLEPGNISDRESLVVQKQIYNRLVEYKLGTIELEPGLATDWEASRNSRVWTFKLRQGVKFHDGTDFDAEAVKFNVERWWDPENKYGYRDKDRKYQIWADLFGGFKGNSKSLLQQIVIKDKYTIQFVLKQPLSIFPAMIGSGYFGIASPTAIKKAGSKYGRESSLAVGTGPFKFKEWRNGKEIILEKSPNYWKPNLPKAEKVIVRFIPDIAKRLTMLKSGEIDFTSDLVPKQLENLVGEAKLKSIFRPSFNVGYLSLNTNYKPLSKQKVRIAIALGINHQKIVEKNWQGLGESDAHFTPPLLDWSESPNFGSYKYDPQLAKQLLREAGYPKGFDLELWYMKIFRPYYPDPKAIAQAIADDLGKIGIKVTLKTKPWKDYLKDRQKSPGFQGFILGWTGEYGDPDNFYYSHFGPNATADLGRWKNNQILRLLETGRKTQDKDARARIYRQVDKILFEEAVRIPIVHSQPLLGKRANIQGWKPSPLGSESFETVDKI